MGNSMNFKRHFTVSSQKLVAVVVVAGLLAACGGGGRGATASSSISGTAPADAQAKILTAKTLVGGTAFTDGPVVGATVKVFDANGNPVDLNTSSTNVNTTNSFGAFGMVFDTKLTGDFRIVVSGGTVNGSPLGASIVADVAVQSNVTADPTAASIHLSDVNVATSLAAAYHDTDPRMTASFAHKAVKDYLAIPQTVELGQNLRGNQQWFDHATFMAKAANNGGLAPNAAVLVAELKSGTQQTRSFTPSTHNISNTDKVHKMILGFTPTEIAAEIFKGALGAAGGAIGDRAAKAVLGNLFGSGAMTVDDIKQLDSKLDDIKHQIKALEAGISQLYNLTAQQNYNTAKGNMADCVKDIQTADDNANKINLYRDPDDPTINEDLILTLKNAITTSVLTGKLSACERTIQNVMRPGGEGSTGSFMAMRSQVVITEPQREFINNSDYYDKMVSVYQYYELVQLQLLNLRLSTDALYDNALGVINADYHQYQEFNASQRAVMPSPLPANTYFNTRNKMMLWTSFRDVPYISTFGNDIGNGPDCRAYNAWTAPQYDDPEASNCQLVINDEWSFLIARSNPGVAPWSEIYPFNLDAVDGTTSIWGMNSHGVGGFTNWRTPNWPELSGMVLRDQNDVTNNINLLRAAGFPINRPYPYATFAFKVNTSPTGVSGVPLGGITLGRNGSDGWVHWGHHNDLNGNRYMVTLMPVRSVPELANYYLK